MAYTYDEDGAMSQSIADRQRKKALEQQREQREHQFRQSALEYFNKENRLRKK